MRISDGSSDVCSSDLLAAGTHTEIAIDAGIQVHRHRGMAEVGLPLLAHREAALGDADVGSPVPELALWIVRGLALRLVGDQHLEHHGARLPGALAGAPHHPPLARRADPGSGAAPPALGPHHDGPALPPRADRTRLVAGTSMSIAFHPG